MLWIKILYLEKYSVVFYAKFIKEEKIWDKDYLA